MGYVLAGVTIKSPINLEEDNSTLYAQNRTLNGSIARDYFGSNKRVWVLDFMNTSTTDYSAINTIYQSYLTTAATKSWSVSDGNYAVTSTNVHVDLTKRKFNVGGTDYISDFSLVLTEA